MRHKESHSCTYGCKRTRSSCSTSKSLRAGLKPTTERAGERILLQVESRNGNPLWESTIDDPRVQVFEAGEDERGRRARKFVEHASPEMMVRVPFFEEGQMVRVTRVSPGKGAPANQKVLGAFRISHK